MWGFSRCLDIAASDRYLANIRSKRLQKCATIRKNISSTG